MLFGLYVPLPIAGVDDVARVGFTTASVVLTSSLDV